MSVNAFIKNLLNEEIARYKMANSHRKVKMFIPKKKQQPNDTDLGSL